MAIHRFLYSLLFVLIVCQSFAQKDSSIFQNLKVGEVVKIEIQRTTCRPNYFDWFHVEKIQDSFKISYLSFHEESIVYEKAENSAIRLYYIKHFIIPGKKYSINKTPIKLRGHFPEGIKCYINGDRKVDSAFYCSENVLQKLVDFENNVRADSLPTSQYIIAGTSTIVKISYNTTLVQTKIRGWFRLSEYLNEFYTANRVRKEIY